MNELPGYVAEDDPVRKAMQFASANPALQEAIAITPEDVSTPEGVTWADTMYDAFANSYAGIALGYDSPNVKWFEGGRDIDDGYDAVNDPDLTDPTKPYSYFMNDFLNTTNSDYARRLKLDIEKDVKRQKMWAQSSWEQYLLGGVISIGADPTTYIPLGVLGKLGLATAKTGAAFRMGQAVEGAILAGGSVALSEVLRQADDPTRSWQDSASSIAIGTAIGAAFGAFFPNLDVNAQNNISRVAVDEVKSWSINPEADIVSVIKNAQSLGAARVESAIDDAGTIIAGTKTRAAFKAANTVMRIPGLRVLTSQSDETRRIGASLTETSATIQANVEGKTLGIPVESAIRNWTSEAATFIDDLGRTYAEMRRAGHKLTFDDFQRAVSDSIQNYRDLGDPPVGSPHYFFKRGADRFNRYMEFAEREAKSAGWLSKTDNAVEQLFPRTFMEGVLHQRRGDFLGLVTQALKDMTKRGDFVSAADMEDAIATTAEAIFNKLTFRNVDDIPLPIKGLKIPINVGPMKGKQLLLPDNYWAMVDGKRVNLSDFLNRNVSSAVMNHAQRFGADVELTRAYGRADMRDQIASIAKYYDEQIKAAGDDLRKIASLTRAERRDIEDIKAMRDMLRRNYKSDAYRSTAGQVITGLNKILPVMYLGNMLINSLTDTAKVVTQHTMDKFFTRALPASSRIAMRNVMENLIRSPKTKRQGIELGVAIEHLTHSRANHMAGLVDEIAALPQNKYNMITDYVNHVFFKFTGVAGWNNFWKEVSANTTLGLIVDNSKEFVARGKISNGYDRAFMARLGFDESTMRDIAKAFDDGIITKDGALYNVDFDKLMAQPNRKTYTIKIQQPRKAGSRATPKPAKFETKTDVEFSSENVVQGNLQRLIRAAVGAEADRIITTPGVGDIPLYVKAHPLTRAIMAFKSFQFASMMKTTLAGVQGRKSQLLNLIVAGQAIGLVQTSLKTLVSGNVEDLEKFWTTKRGFAELNGKALDENSFFPVLNMVLDTAERMTGVPLTPGTVIPELAGGRVSAHAKKNPYIQSPTTVAAGPAGALFDDMFTALGAVYRWGAEGKEPTERERRKMYRLFPGTSLPYIKPAAEYLIGNEQLR